MRYQALTRLVAGGAALLLVATSAVAQTAQPVKIRLQTAVPSASIYFELLKRYADRIDKMSAGRVKMEVLPDGAIVPAFEILDAVDKGVVEAGYAWTHYWSGKNPTAGLFSNPMAGAGAGLDQLSHMAWLLEGGGMDLYRKFYTQVLKVNVEPFMVQPMGPDPLGWFKNPINSVADFKKLKYRSPPGITGEIFKEMGVGAVALPGGEIVPAAQRGVIDAAEWIGPADDLNLGLHTIWKNYYLQGLHQSTDVGEVIINKGVYDKLPADVKEIMKAAAMASMAETYAFNVARNAAAIVKLKNEFKVEIRDTPKDFFPEFVRATTVVLDRYAAKDPFFKEVLESQRNFGKTVVPYWTKVLDLYSNLGNAALQAK
jgi:TRAP-type mannitol/chloroaromatic compound transport system substrate-binding protein